MRARPPIVVVGVEKEWAARALESVLGPHGYAVVRAYSGIQALDLAEVAAPDVVIVESRLPDLDGLEVCRRLRRDGRIAPQVPLIVMTSAAAPRDFLRECYEAGAWSVWEQPVDGELLLLRLDSWVAAKRASDDAERDRIIERDAGLYTYRALAHRADELVADAARRRTPLTCIAVTVAARGGDAADALPAPVATEVARALASAARGSDIIARLAAAEFAILAPDTPPDGATRLAERLREKLADIGGAGELRAGIAAMTEADAQTRSGGELVVRAVTALRYATYGPEPARTIRRFDDVPSGFL
ncbi:MAG: response regulator [Gemmatimonadaceae bacterium]|nr:response regulator [Gemmatimonadaceae bacterium]